MKHQELPLPLQKGLAQQISDAFFQIGRTLTPLEAMCLSYVGYFPGKGPRKKACYMLIKEESAYIVTLASEALRYNTLAVQCVQLSELPSATKNLVPVEETHHWSHYLSRAFNELGGQFSHISAASMPLVTTDSAGSKSYATLIHGKIYFVYQGVAYKAIPVE